MIDCKYINSLGLPQRNEEIFKARLEVGKIKSSKKFERLFDDEDFVETLNLLHIDVQAFKTLALFVNDYSVDVCLNGTEQIAGGYEMMWELIEHGRKIVNGEKPEKIDADASCRFKLQGRNYDVKDPEAIAVLLYWIHRGMIHMEEADPIWELNWLIDDYDMREIAKVESASVTIWCFASLMRIFFANNPQIKGRASRGSGLSLNKLLIISQLVYALGLSTNENFQYSDETLKGFLRQYKSKKFPSQGKIYKGE